MRKSVFSVFAATALALSGLLAGAAASQVAPMAPQVAPAAELSEEDKTATPFPPGRYASVVKKVCVDCHGAKVIVDLRYTREDAENFYKNMVSEDLTTDQAKQIIEYLTTTLAP